PIRAEFKLPRPDQRVSGRRSILLRLRARVRSGSQRPLLTSWASQLSQFAADEFQGGPRAAHRQVPPQVHEPEFVRLEGAGGRALSQERVGGAVSRIREEVRAVVSSAPAR